MARLVAVLAFLLGTSATVAQVLLLREILVVLDGNELSIGLALAAWLLGVGLGAALGGAWADRLQRPAVLAGAALLSMAVLLPVAILAIRYVRHVLGLPQGAVVPAGQAILLCLGALVPVSLGVGLSFAPLVRAFDHGRGPAKASWIYAIEAGGALVGGLLFSLVLAGRVPHLVAAGVLATLMCAGVAALSVAIRAKASFALSAILCLASCWLLASSGWAGLERLSSEVRWRSLGTGTERVATADSPYQHLDLAESDGQYDLFANGSHMLSFPDPWDRAAPVHVAMTQPSRIPGKVLLLGGGVADRVAAVLEHGPSRVDFVSLDPAELEIVRDFLPTRDRASAADRRVRVVHADGRRFVREAPAESYDLLVVSAPDPVTGQANRYYTREFHRECRRVLVPDGVLATGVGSAVNAFGTEAGVLAASLHASLVESFGHVAIWPGQQTRFYAAARPGVVSDDEQVLATRFRARGARVDSFSEHRFEGLMPPALVAEARRAFAAADPRPNTDRSPVAYLYGLALWDQRARGAGEPSPLWRLRGVRLSWIVLPLLVIAAIRLLRKRGPSAALADGTWAILTGGAFGLALEVVLLLQFQNAAGSLYQSLGLLVGTFMGGLALGTLISERLCRGGRPRHVARLVDGGTIVAALLPLLVPFLGGHAVGGVGLLMGIAGFFTGATFPPGLSLIAAGLAGGREGRVAGLADGLDHFGAVIGAVSVALVILPVAGLGGAVACVVALKGISLAGLARGGTS